ncbi:hypothetical protein [Bifidobacterium sp. ESL0825]|uniref:hypothetical protein n=1 Tax=Bifidobacterium sp. ESL0825 TaxID=3448587 RepID=UPI0040423AC7
MSLPIIAVLVTLLATLAVVVPLELSVLSTNQANAADGQDETASRKPKLYRMMAFNDRIDAYREELRMDFILRVKHNEFKPDCVGVGGTNTKIPHNAIYLSYISLLVLTILTITDANGI